MAIFLFFLSIALVLFFNLYKYKTLLNDLFHPSLYLIGFIYVFFILNQIQGRHAFATQTALLVLIATATWCFGFYFKWYKIVKVHNYFSYDYVKPLSYKRYICYQSILVVATFFLFIVRIRSAGYSLEQYLVNSLLFNNENTKAGGNIWAFAFNIFNYCILVNHFRIATSRKEKNVTFVLIFIFSLFFNLAQLQTNRFSYIMSVLMAFAMWGSLKMKKPTIPKALLIFLPIALPIMAIFNQLRQGESKFIDDGISISSLMDMGQATLSADANPGVNFDLLVKYLDETNDYHYGFFFVSQLFFVVPRVIWASKPITSFSFQYTINIMHEDPIVDGTTYTFTYMDTYAAFGWISLVLVTFLFALLTRYLYESIYQYRNIFIMLFAIPFISNYINILRASFVDIFSYYFLDFFFIIVTYFICKKIKIVS